MKIQNAINNICEYDENEIDVDVCNDQFKLLIVSCKYIAYVFHDVNNDKFIDACKRIASNNVYVCVNDIDALFEYVDEFIAHIACA